MIPLSQKGALHMLRVPRMLHHLVQLTCTLLTLLVDAAHFLWLCLHSPTALAAENLFLRKQLALYQERHVTPRRATDATRLALLCPAYAVGLSRETCCLTSKAGRSAINQTPAPARSDFAYLWQEGDRHDVPGSCPLG